MTKRLLIVTTAITAVLHIAACGDDGGGSGSTTSTQSGSDSSTQPATESLSATSTSSTSGSETGSDSSEGSEGSSSSSSGGEIPEFDPVELDCPFPASLPFSTESMTWANAAAEAVAADNPRVKDEAADILGNPGGLLAYTTMPQGDSPAATLNIFAGRKQRTLNDAGLTGEPLAEETVSLWTYNGAWVQAARGLTDANGGYSFGDVELSSTPDQAFYAILEGEQSCSPHYMMALDPGSNVILADIDGTLTQSDEEFTMQIMDGGYDPLEKTAASQMMQTWAEKGYRIIYVTARPHAFRAETRSWLRAHGFPPGAVITANSLVFEETAREYKRTWVSRMRDDFGWVVTAAYGNAESDIQAFADGGISPSITFIVGEFAGTMGTEPIENDDYTDHIAAFVDVQPDA